MTTVEEDRLCIMHSFHLSYRDESNKKTDDDTTSPFKGYVRDININTKLISLINSGFQSFYEINADMSKLKFGDLFVCNPLVLVHVLYYKYICLCFYVKKKRGVCV